MEIRDRRFILKSTALDLSGASLQIQGTYAWAGAVDLNVKADLRRLRRRWLMLEDDSQSRGNLTDVRLGGHIDHLVVNPQIGVTSARGNRGRGEIR
jgi:hypothetical protein